MWRSPLPKGILGGPHLDHMIASSVPSSRDLHRSERPAKLNTRSVVPLTDGIDRNWRVIMEIRGSRACPTSLHQTRTSTSWVMSDASSFLQFLPITVHEDGRRGTLTWFDRESWTWKCFQTVLKPAVSISFRLWLLFMNHLQQNRQSPSP